MGEVVRLETPLPRAGPAKNGLWGLGGRVLTQFSPVLGVVCRKEVAVRDLSNAGAEYEVRWVRMCV